MSVRIEELRFRLFPFASHGSATGNGRISYGVLLKLEILYIFKYILMVLFIYLFISCFYHTKIISFNFFLQENLKSINLQRISCFCCEIKKL